MILVLLVGIVSLTVMVFFQWNRLNQDERVLPASLLAVSTADYSGSHSTNPIQAIGLGIVEDKLKDSGLQPGDLNGRLASVTAQLKMPVPSATVEITLTIFFHATPTATSQASSHPPVKVTLTYFPTATHPLPATHTPVPSQTIPPRTATLPLPSAPVPSDTATPAPPPVHTSTPHPPTATSQPPTSVPPTSVPPTSVPPTSVPPTVAPPHSTKAPPPPKPTKEPPHPKPTKEPHHPKPTKKPKK